MTQNKQATNITTIDIGTYKIYTSIAHVNTQDNAINILSSCCRKTRGIHNDVITDLEKLGDTILDTIIEVERQSQQHVRSVSVGVPQQFVITKQRSRTIHLNGNIITQKHVQDFMRSCENSEIGSGYEVIHVFVVHYIIDNKTFVKNPINMFAQSLQILCNIVYCDINFTKGIKRTLQHNNIEVDAFVLSQYASALSTTYNDERKNGITVIDIGYDNTSIVYMVNNSICELYSLNMGSNNITKAISSMLNIVVENDAENIKITRCHATTEKYMYNMFASQDEMIQYKSIDKHNNIFTDYISVKRVNSVVSSVVDQLFANIISIMRQSKYKNICNKIIITGGGSKLNGLHAFLTIRKVFNNAVFRIGNPINIKHHAQMEDKTASFATSAGLLLYVASNSIAHKSRENILTRLINKLLRR